MHESIVVIPEMTFECLGILTFVGQSHCLFRIRFHVLMLFGGIRKRHFLGILGQ